MKQCFTSDSFQIDGIMKRSLIIKKNLQLQFVGNAQQIVLIPCMNARYHRIMIYYTTFVIHKHFQEMLSKIYLIKLSIIKVLVTQREQLGYLLTWVVKTN